MGFTGTVDDAALGKVADAITHAGVEPTIFLRVDRQIRLAVTLSIDGASYDTVHDAVDDVTKEMMT